MACNHRGAVECDEWYVILGREGYELRHVVRMCRCGCVMVQLHGSPKRDWLSVEIVGLIMALSTARSRGLE